MNMAYCEKTTQNGEVHFFRSKDDDALRLPGDDGTRMGAGGGIGTGTERQASADMILGENTMSAYKTCNYIRSK